MAIAVWGFTLVVPLASIERGFTGGVQAWLEEVDGALGQTVWLDDRLAGMSYYDPELASHELDKWLGRGFRSKSLHGRMRDDELLALVVDSSLGVSLSDCDWLEFDANFPCVWPHGHERGNVAVPSGLKDKLPLKNTNPASNSNVDGAPDTQLVDPAVSGIEAFEAGDFAKAFQCLNPLARDASRFAWDKSMLCLATMYAQGKGVERDFAQASALLLRAGDAGQVGAYVSLGRMYETGAIHDGGRGIPKDLERAYYWYQKALAAGDERAAEGARRVRPAVSRKDLSTLKIEVPEQQHRVTAGREYSAEQWATIQRGLLPESMDDKWIAFVEGHRLLVLRSWTGWLFADATFEPAGEGMRLTHFLAPREATVSAEYQRDMLYWVIDALNLGNRNAVFPDSEAAVPSGLKETLPKGAPAA